MGGLKENIIQGTITPILEKEWFVRAGRIDDAVDARASKVLSNSILIKEDDGESPVVGKENLIRNGKKKNGQATFYRMEMAAVGGLLGKTEALLKKEES